MTKDSKLRMPFTEVKDSVVVVEGVRMEIIDDLPLSDAEHGLLSDMVAEVTADDQASDVNATVAPGNAPFSPS